jgi:hypothetical protein
MPTDPSVTIQVSPEFSEIEGLNFFSILLA